MRELKFRVWDNQSDFYWGEGEGMDFKKIAFNFYDSLFEECRLVFQQYTGLQDKNGKDIYEGDIISFGVIDEDDLFWVVWEDIESRFILESNGGLGCWLLDVSDREIIGNIFENSELLK